MIVFKEDTHQYFNSQTNEEYISVTTFLSKFKQPFNSEYWSLYKAIEKFSLENEHDWNKYKEQVSINPALFLKRCKIDSQNRILELKKEILSDWKDIKDEACRIGTQIHKEKELEILKNKGEVIKGIFYPIGSIENNSNKIKLTEGIYPEIVLYSHKYKICGTSDKIIIDSNFNVCIDDYKTNKKIDLKSFKDKKLGYKMMLNPLEYLMDCNFIHYALQISTYAFLLEEEGYIINTEKLSFTHLILNRDKTDINYGNVVDTKIYNVPYLRNEVKQILKLRL